VRFVCVRVELPQAREVNEPQLPERSCTRIFEGAEESVMVCEVACATKVYHTSYLSDAPQPGLGKLDGFHVALTFVPAVLIHVADDVSAIAPEHSLFAGCAKELKERTIPSSKKAKVAIGYRKRFISS